MNYKKLNKAQLIERIEELEAQSIKARAERFIQEAQLLGVDLLRLTRNVYNLGAEARLTIHSLIPIRSNESGRTTPIQS